MLRVSKTCAYFFLICLTLALSSCATIPLPEERVSVEQLPQEEWDGYRKTITHEVGPGETVWRISKMYDVTITDIARANDLKDVTKLEMGQKLVIPNAATMRPLVPLYPSKKWRYIIIHHSATDMGKALSISNGHIRRGFSGLGYHFLIDNGTQGKANGQIEISPRWIKQQNGAHCQASQMNYKAIGICLVGNLSKEKPTAKQLQSLVNLVNTLRRYYRIPLSNIMGHGDVPDARTECPGRLFPWSEFRSKLKSETEIRSVRGKPG
jgi:LysM repeat protein